MEDMGVLGALEASVALEDCTEEACMEVAMVTVRYLDNVGQREQPACVLTKVNLLYHI